MLSSRTRRGRKRSAASVAGSSVPHSSSGGSPTPSANGGGSSSGELCAEVELGLTEDRTQTAAAALHRPRRRTIHPRAFTVGEGGTIHQRERAMSPFATLLRPAPRSRYLPTLRTDTRSVS